MSTRTLNLDDQLYAYFQRIALREHTVLQDLRQENTQYSAGKMQIAPEQGQFMAFLIKLMNVKKALEIGTYTGYSALSVALALPKDGQLTCCELSKRWLQIASAFWAKANVQDKIRVKQGPAQESLDALIEYGESDSFDFIFIDADKRGYPHYYEKSLTLLRRGGLIAIDNIFRDGNVIAPTEDDKATQVICAFNDALHADQRIDLSIVPIGDGLTLARKR